MLSATQRHASSAGWRFEAGVVVKGRYQLKASEYSMYMRLTQSSRHPSPLMGGCTLFAFSWAFMAVPMAFHVALPWAFMAAVVLARVETHNPLGIYPHVACIQTC